MPEHFEICQVRGCKEPSFKKRRLCERHAFPGEATKSERRRAIEYTKRKNKAKVASSAADKGD